MARSVELQGLSGGERTGKMIKFEILQQGTT